MISYILFGLFSFFFAVALLLLLIQSIVNNSLHRKYGIRVSYKSIRLKKYNEWILRNVKLRKNDSKFTLQIDELKIKVWFKGPSSLKPQISSLEISGAEFQVNKLQKIVTEVPRDKPPAVFNYTHNFKLFNRLSSALFSFIPSQVSVTNFKIHTKQCKNLALNNACFYLSDSFFRLTFELNQDGGTPIICSGNGIFDRLDNKIVLEEFASASKEFKVNLGASFIYSLKGKSELKFQLSVSDITLNHSIIYKHPITINDFQLNLNAHIDKDSVIIDRSSVKYNNINAAINCHLNGLSNEFRFFANSVPMHLEDILKSFPLLSFNRVSATKTNGELSLLVDLKFNINNPGKYSFISKLEKTNFRIESLGKPNLKYLSEPFVHKVFENDRFIKDIVLESIDKNFVSINLVPNHLIRAVLYGEDPNFYKHKGIDEIYVGLAIIANYTNRKFTRGASTITMQLVRNLFLTKEKSLYRKVEEIILAWHLEEIYKISKDRQLEIYLNIIEFAPGLYGIANASQFYFDKRISELTVLESLVLTYIIPRPKYFLEAVELKSTKLQRNLKKHVSFYSNIMFKKGVISELELKNLGNEIRFSQNINSSIFL